MYLRFTRRNKDGKQHRYWSVVESRRCAGGFPTTDGRTLILTRYTEPSADQKLLVCQLNLDLPPQPPPRITAAQSLQRSPAPAL